MLLLEEAYSLWSRLFGAAGEGHLKFRGRPRYPGVGYAALARAAHHRTDSPKTIRPHSENPELRRKPTKTVVC